MTSRRWCGPAVLVGLLLCQVEAGTASQAPPLTRARMAEFLRSAEVIDARPIGRGVTGSWRLTLSDGTLTHDAAFQSVDRRRDEQRIGRRLERNFVDSYRYNIAAYGLAGLLGLEEMMPVTVERRWKGMRGAASWWLDDVAFDEQARRAEGRWPDDMRVWTLQTYRMRLFSELVQDSDRNHGNILYTDDWKLYMIDFTRAFRLSDELELGDLTRCDRRLFERLKTLTLEAVREAAEHLTGDEARAVLRRRDVLVRHFEALIAARGDELVLY